MLSTFLRRAFALSVGSGMLLAALVTGLPAAQAQEPNEIVIKNFMFSPMSLTVKAGTTVTWKNMDGEPHSIVNDAGVFHSTALDENDTYRFKFDKPGVYKVFCGIHPYMKATITVQ
ncbi:cupredoxin domain-containing protein [Trinickia terrae]|nr:cupredoxin family copper-binding protein [Trinickia terrae]